MSGRRKPKGARPGAAAKPLQKNLSEHVHIRGQERARRQETVVEIDHLIPSDEHAVRGWRVTTKDQRLFRAHFHAKARDEIKCASQERGRRLFCIDRERQEVMAAISYHLDDDRSMPLLLTAIALRIDVAGPAALYNQSRAAALILKQYAHEIARRTGRGAYVDIDASPAAANELARLGFRKAPQVRGFRVSGLHLRQDPLG